MGSSLRRRLCRKAKQLSFALPSSGAGGQTRPMVVRGDDAPIIDVKASREQPWHAAQVMISMYALPRALPQYRDARLAGEIIYPTRRVQVPKGSVHNQFIHDLGDLYRAVVAELEVVAASIGAVLAILRFMRSLPGIPSAPSGVDPLG